MGLFYEIMCVSHNGLHQWLLSKSPWDIGPTQEAAFCPVIRVAYYCALGACVRPEARSQGAERQVALKS